MYTYLCLHRLCLPRSIFFVRSPSRIALYACVRACVRACQYFCALMCRSLQYLLSVCVSAPVLVPISLAVPGFVFEIVFHKSVLKVQCNLNCRVIMPHLLRKHKHVYTKHSRTSIQRTRIVGCTSGCTSTGCTSRLKHQPPPFLGKRNRTLF